MKKWIYRIIMLVCICVFGYSAFHLYQIYSDKHQVEQETQTYQKMATSSKDSQVLNPDWDALQQSAPDIVAWLYVPGCDINFPVVQGSDNSYYLDHTTGKQSSPYGSIFLDYKANNQFMDDNSIIYGHSVEGGGMFTNLKNFTDESFFNKHDFFYLFTPNGNYKCTIYTFAKTTDSSSFYTTAFGSYRDETLAKWVSDAMYSRAVDTTSTHFVSLSTCNLDYGFHSNQRYVLTGAMEAWTDPITVSD